MAQDNFQKATCTDSIGFNSISYPKIHNLARKCTKRHRIDSKGFIYTYKQI